MKHDFELRTYHVAALDGLQRRCMSLRVALSEADPQHEGELRALERVFQSSVTVIHPDERDFNATCKQFERYDDQHISFTDHMSGVLASGRDIDHIFTFDADHFRTLGFTAVPDDTGEA